MSSPAYIVGIDLGTTNCAVAFAEPSQGRGAPVADFPIPQLQRPGEVAELPLLASSIYIPAGHELTPQSTRLPWGNSAERIAGAFARWQGARVPGRLVASAKSWLCHPGVDRSAPILPWGAPPAVSKVSPVEASAILLRHIRSAWDHAHPAAPLDRQDVVITVPASFDEVARALTVDAARQAGLEKLTLVEEPQAAFYDFTAAHQGDLAKVLNSVKLVLVVDVGGGTSDFTVIQVSRRHGELDLRRLAVGEHLMLGGDNMDAALARHAEEKLSAGGRRLGSSQWTHLLQAARNAKEALLGERPPDKQIIAIASEGSRLVAGILSCDLHRADAERLILEGFFPECGQDETPRRAARTAVQELGLPYAQDPAITRHLAAFLRQHAAACFTALGVAPTETRLPRPDAVLFNGGVFNSPRIRERLIHIISSWWPDGAAIPTLPHRSLDSAVARGAACYGLARRGLARRIAGGSAHALYVELESKGGASGAKRAICLVPHGQEEGQAVDLQSRPFDLVLGQPVQFPLYSTASDRSDRPGEVVDVGEDFRSLPRIHALLKSAKSAASTAPVHLRALLTELGTLELWCVSDASDERWRLEFELRAAGATEAATDSLPERFDEVRAMIRRVFGESRASDPQEAKSLFRSLEKMIGSRAEWRPAWLRELWSDLYNLAPGRRASPDHERVFYQLLGYSLRPGFGYPLDDWRCKQTFRLFGESIVFYKDASVWSEFWVLWRRIAGGLTESQHQTIWTALRSHLARRIPPVPLGGSAKPKGILPEGFDEMARLAASLEHLLPTDKAVLGDWIADRIRNPKTAAGPWTWALGRIGAREPIYGSSHKTVYKERAAKWLAALLDAGLTEGASFAAAQIARLTGDRERDVDDEIRSRTIAGLQSVGAPESWQRMVTEVITLEALDEARALGDTLPIGLRLAAAN